MPTPLIATAADQAIGLLVLDLVASLVVLVALVRTVTTPAERWAHGRLSKTAWIVAILWLIPVAHGVAIPIGAGAVIWRTRQLRRRADPDPADLPWAEGTPVGTEDDGKERQ